MEKQNIHTMEYYLAIKGDEVMMCAATQMNLENHTLSKGSKHKRPHYVIDSIYMNVQNRQIYRDRKK